MGEAKRRKKLDPNYGKSTKNEVTELKLTEKVQQCKGDFAYRLAYDLNDIPDSHINDGEEDNNLAVVHYLTHIQQANNYHPLKRFKTDKLIQIFHDLWNKEHYHILTNVWLFYEYLRVLAAK